MSHSIFPVHREVGYSPDASFINLFTLAVKFIANFLLHSLKQTLKRIMNEMSELATSTSI